MIIRRRHTKNFTTIGNELFDDHRLAADEVGILAYLLSRPDDWEVRRPALMRRWKIGGDRVKRIIHNLILTGWCQAHKTRLQNGTFHIIYEILDSPGPSMTEDEVKEALSLVSGEASETDSPDPTQPGVDDQGVVTGGWPIESLPNTNLLNPDSHQTEGGKNFSDLQKAWPSDDILSPLVCEKLFAALPRRDQQQAIDAARPYVANCRARNRKICDLSTYLKERRFDRTLAKSSNSLWRIEPGTPQAARWLDHWLKLGVQPYASVMLELGRTVTLETEWPPALPTKDESTGPPDSDLMSPEDREEMVKKWG